MLREQIITMSHVTERSVRPRSLDTTHLPAHIGSVLTFVTGIVTHWTELRLWVAMRRHQRKTEWPKSRSVLTECNRSIAEDLGVPDSAPRKGYRNEQYRQTSLCGLTARVQMTNMKNWLIMAKV